MIEAARVAQLGQPLVVGTLTALVTLVVGCGQPPAPQVRSLPVVHPARLLSESAHDWEPDLAAGIDGEVYVTAGRRYPREGGAEGGPPFEQRIVIWRSPDSGETWEGPWPVSAEGSMHGDQRIVVDGNGVVHVSYIQIGKDEAGTMTGLLRLATSRDGGRTFSVRTVLDRDVSDKPELAMSADGRVLYIVLESRPGPSIVASHDRGETWGEPRVVVPVEGRATHFWPTGLEVATDGRLWFSVPSIPNDELQRGGPSTTTLHVFTSADQGASWHETVLGSFPWVRGGCPHDPDCRVKLAYPGVAVDAAGRGYAVSTEGNKGETYRLMLRSSDDGGRTWSKPQPVSEAPRPSSADLADHEYPMVTASGDGRVCVVWVDDRKGPYNLWARCSADAGGSWGDDLLLSSGANEPGHTTADGFKVFYGDYGGAALTEDGRLHATWGAASSMNGPGTIWVTSADVFEPARPTGES